MRFFKAIYWQIRIAHFALRWIGTNSLGDEVTFNGRKWILVQGVAAPMWTLQRGDERVEVHEQYFDRASGLRAAIRSFRSGYRFYMTSWYHIWMTQGIQPWVKNLHIWK